MKELEECLSFRREIKRIDEQITEIKAVTSAPKNQVITGMPRGSGTVNQFDRYLIRLENLNKKRQSFEMKLNYKWRRVHRLLNAANVRDEHITMLKVRFYFGKQWEECANIMGEKYGTEKWNVSKCFRVYRATLRKLKEENA